MKDEMMTVNVEFKIKVPVERDNCGRRISPTSTIGKYLEEFFSELSMNQSGDNRFMNEGKGIFDKLKINTVPEDGVYEEIGEKSKKILNKKYKIYEHQYSTRIGYLNGC